MPKEGLGRFVLPLILLHLAIVLPLAFLLNIWADEASTLYTTQNGFLYAFQNAAADEKQAPLYFWVMSLWRMIDGSIFFARLFSIICSVAAISSFATLADRLFGGRVAILATAYFALHPFFIWASLEIRVYSLVILLSVLLIRIFLNAFVDREGKIYAREKVLFLFLSVVALYSQYYLGFLLAGLFIALLVMQRWRAARDYAVVMFVAGVAFLPIAFSVVSQFDSNTAGFQEPRPAIEGVRLLWHHFLTLTLPTGILSGDTDVAVTIVRLWVVRVAVLIIAIFMLINRIRPSRQTLALGGVVAAIFCGLLTAYLLLGPTYIAIRHSSVLFVPLILFITSLMTDLFAGSEKQAWQTRIAVLGCAAVVLSSFAYSLATLHPNLTKRGDWARIGSFIEQNESAGQPIVVFPVFTSLALPYHYKGQNQILPREKFFDFGAEATFGSPESLARENQYVISIIPPDAQTLWLALGEKCLITEACAPLENFVRANYTIEAERDFYLERVYLLRKKQ